MFAKNGAIGINQGQSVTTVSPGKTAEPIEVVFGMLTLLCPSNYVIDGDPDPDPVTGRALLTEAGLSSKFFDHLLLLLRVYMRLF